MKQPNNIFQSEFNFSGPELRDAGIELAVETAENKNIGWKETTWNLFKEFLKDQREPFLLEDFRSWIAVNYEDYEFPKTLRAFGIVTVRAKKEGLVKSIGTRKVRNAKAHCANASLLIRV